MAVDKELRHLQDEQRRKERQSIPRVPLPSEVLKTMDRTELKNVILELFDRQRELNAMLAEKDRASAEKGSPHCVAVRKAGHPYLIIESGQD